MNLRELDKLIKELIEKYGENDELVIYYNKKRLELIRLIGNKMGKLL